MKQVEQIIAKVSSITGVPMNVITSKRRTRMASYARFLAVSAIRKRLPWMSLSDISLAVGAGDHGQAAHAIRRTQELIKSDILFAQHAHSLSITSSPN